MSARSGRSRSRRLAAASLAALGLAAAMLAAQGPAQASAALLRVHPHPLPHVGRNSYLGGVWCVTARSCWAVGGYAKANGADVNQALYWNGRKWALTRTADPAGTASGDINLLVSVACASSEACWAVGFDTGFTGPIVDQALHWTGTRWTRVRTPQPGGTASSDVNELTGISCPAVRECWAVGGYDNGKQGRNQILRWNGTKWSQVSVPNPAGKASSDGSSLAAVICASTRSCWAVGGYSKVHKGRVRLNQALHWNGRRWSLVATPDLAAKKGINNLSSVSCTAPRDCWAVGDYGSASSPGPSLSQILHWNGTKWSAVSAPEPAGTGRGADNFLAAVSCTSATNCWAAGDYGSNRTATSVVRNQTVHWNGHQWALVPSPDPAGTGSGDFNFLSGISCSSAASCWAVGARAPKSGTDRDQALRWNGASWSGYS